MSKQHLLDFSKLYFCGSCLTRYEPKGRPVCPVCGNTTYLMGRERAVMYSEIGELLCRLIRELSAESYLS